MQIKTLFNRENILYTILFSILMIVIIINRIYCGFENIVWLTDFASIFSIIGVIFLAKHSIIGPISCLISTAFTIPVSLVQSIWLNVIINTFIILPFWTLSIIRWRKSNKSNTVFIQSLNKYQTITTTCILICLIVLVAYILYLFNGNLFYLDAPYSILCATAVIFSSFALIQQFYLFSLANAIGIIMYFLLTLQNINNICLIFVNLILLIINISALINWRKILKNKQNTTTTNTTQQKKGLI